ncbi:MAG: 2-oxoisovalerate dehydrogenase [Candidatus Eisenbacteria bacterium]|nr:2-oxoisovalerate dehydrogenase [Candidatus Eisenbacteria bacterium]
MFTARRIDEQAPNYLKLGLGWSYHAPCSGHEGIQLAAGVVFRPRRDFLFPYYRDMQLALAAGISEEEIFLNGMSKQADVASGGRHMSNHFAKPELNIQNVSSCTGNHLLHAAGLGRAVKLYDDDAIVYCSMGESALSEGYCYEALLGISREKLPVILVAQDNGYGISVPKRDQSANARIAENFRGLPNLEIIYCDGTDPVDSHRAMQKAIAFVRAKKGGAIVYADCVRIGAHSNSDNHLLYRDERELAAAHARDPLPRFRRHLLESAGIPVSEVERIEAQVKTAVDGAAERARAAAAPDPAGIFDFVLPPAADSPGYPDGTNPAGLGEKRTFREAINGVLHDEFRRNPHTFLWGQDMANKEKEGIFLVTKGMQKEFGARRVFNAPLAEDFIVGTANGFSRYRKDIRVVVEGAEFADYFWPAMEQLIECTHDYWRSNGQFAPNMVIRLASGGYIGGGLYHSQNLEGTFTTLPGVRVVMPAFADDAAGLLRTALRSEGPTLFLEPKFLYNQPFTRCPVPEDFTVPFGRARVRREGTDLSVVAYGTVVHFALEAAKKLAGEGVSVEVLDLRSLQPLDEEAVLTTARKTGRVLVAHEDKVFGGFGGELAALVASRAFEYLDAPVERVGSTFTPVGFNRILEAAVLPSEAKLLQAMRKVLSY